MARHRLQVIMAVTMKGRKPVFPDSTPPDFAVSADKTSQNPPWRSARDPRFPFAQVGSESDEEGGSRTEGTFRKDACCAVEALCCWHGSGRMKVASGPPASSVCGLLGRLFRYATVPSACHAWNSMHHSVCFSMRCHCQPSSAPLLTGGHRRFPLTSWGY